MILIKPFLSAETFLTPASSPTREETACGSGLRALRVARKMLESPLSTPKLETTEASIASESSSPLSILRYSSPCSSRSPSPPRLPRLLVLPYDNSSEEISADITAGHLMSDEEVAIYFIQSPKISLPSRLGALKLLLNVKILESPTGPELYSPISEAERYILQTKYTAQSPALISACLIERRNYTSSLVDLLERAISDNMSTYKELKEYLLHTTSPIEEQVIFVEYFKSLKKLHRCALLKLRTTEDFAKASNSLKREIKTKISLFWKKLPTDLDLIFSRYTKVFEVSLQNLSRCNPEAKVQIDKLNAAIITASALNQIKLKSTQNQLVLDEILKLLRSKEAMNEDQYHFIDAILNTVQLYRKTQMKHRLNAFDLEILKSK